MSQRKSLGQTNTLFNYFSSPKNKPKSNGDSKVEKSNQEAPKKMDVSKGKNKYIIYYAFIHFHISYIYYNHSYGSLYFQLAYLFAVFTDILIGAL